MEKKQIIFILGGPACGKGTQCSKALNDLNVLHLSAGELLREEINKKGKNAELIQTIIDKGEIVPVEITLELIKCKIEGSNTNKILIDGFPRNKNNYDGWNKILGEIYDIKGIIYIKCSDENLKERILKRSLNSNRSDDNENLIKKRIETFYNLNMPIINIYKEKNLVKEVDGNRGIDEIYHDFKECLNQFYK